MSQHEFHTHPLVVHFNRRLTDLMLQQLMMMDLLAAVSFWRGLDDWSPLPGEFPCHGHAVTVLPEDVVIPDREGE